MRINVSADLRELSRKLSYAQREQVPFAASMALNNVGQDVANAITAQMENKLDNPTPFTMRAYRFIQRQNRANKRNLTVIVEPAEIQKSYLKFQIEGGTRLPKQTAIFVPSDKAPKNQYGNVPRARRKAMIEGKGKYFTAGKREGKTPGIYYRPTKGVVEPMGFYVDSARYKPILPVQRIAKGVVSSKFDRRFQEALKRAMATAV